MTKVGNLLLIILLLCGTTIWGNNGLRISGRIKSIKANDFTNKRYE